MFGESGTGPSKTYQYYKCTRAKKAKLCDKKAVRKEWIEEIAIKKALDILENEELVNLLVDRLYILYIYRHTPQAHTVFYQYIKVFNGTQKYLSF